MDESALSAIVHAVHIAYWFPVTMYFIYNSKWTATIRLQAASFQGLVHELNCASSAPTPFTYSGP